MGGDAEHRSSAGAAPQPGGVDEGPARPAPFVWPPRLPDPDESSRPEAPREPELEPPEAFQIGAGPEGHPAAGSVSGQPDPARVRRRWASVRLEAVLGEFERTWVGVAASPLATLPRSWEAMEAAIEVCPRCGAGVGRFESDAAGCPGCRARRLPWARVVRLGAYEGALRERVHAFKFGPWRRVGVELGVRLGEAVRARLEEHGLDPSRAVVVPVPTTLRRRMERGIDHALVLGRAMRAELGCRLARPIARSHRPSQLAVAPSERAANVARSFRARRRPPPLGEAEDWREREPVIVVDDVMTSGATMRAACRAIAAARRAQAGRGGSGGGAGRADGGAKAWAAVVGVTPMGDGRRGDASVLGGD